MKRNRLLLPLALLLLLTCACSGGNSSSASSAGEEAAPEAMAPMEATVADQRLNFSESESAAGESRVYSDENAKLIRRASARLQTDDFSAAEAALNALVVEQGGYYESAAVEGGGYYDRNAARYGSYVIRVPRQAYDTFLSGVDGVGYVVSLNQSSEEIGEVYFDTEARLRTQQTKQTRLLALLEQAATMEDIIDLENALSEVEYQIEKYSTELRRYDSLVDYATIGVELYEVRRLSDGAGTADRLGTRISTALSEGAQGAGEALGNVIVWCAYHLIALLVLAAAAAVVLAVCLRRRKKRAAPPAASAPAEPPAQE
ncbi:DUF4349 domain-containing protein [Flavonifractor sp. DFI.6.63]|uniref:DUF4349 domain-containing protein n=1 Tax=Flavonifractor sp. DFI.6.63 TaxID=2963704 RepID=UPI00210960FA|nr:DUF4349 domain-containing protein [Flavonifractor sp. DFI.6.63]MCQ5030749.1 DUF4349 domain-containing protein [Flavonifractor sp. DFI.6.63]